MFRGNGGKTLELRKRSMKREKSGQKEQTQEEVVNELYLCKKIEEGCLKKTIKSKGEKGSIQRLWCRNEGGEGCREVNLSVSRAGPGGVHCLPAL